MPVLLRRAVGARLCPQAGAIESLLKVESKKKN